MGMELIFRQLAAGEHIDEVFTHLDKTDNAELVRLLWEHSIVLSKGMIKIWGDTLSGNLRKRVERIAQIAFLSEDEVQKTTFGVNLILVASNAPDAIYDKIQGSTAKRLQKTGNELVDKKMQCVYSLSLLWAAILWVHKQERLKEYM